MFSESVKKMLAAGRPANLDCLVDAARETQLAMNDLLTNVLARWHTEDFSDLYDPLPRESALMILQNTATPTRRRVGPALAATLIGGLIASTDSKNGFTGHVVSLGDGVVEHVMSDGRLIPLLEMDRNETTIDAFVAPGPQGAAAMHRLTSVSVSLGPGDLLLASSDGLARGHELPVWQELCHLLRRDLHTVFDSPADSARMLLDEAASIADHLREGEARSHLFNDNLSIVLTARTASPR
jgi:hypothetical protein